MILLSLVCCLLGFLTVSLSMQRHHSQLFNKRKLKAKEPILLKTGGFSLLGLGASTWYVTGYHR